MKKIWMKKDWKKVKEPHWIGALLEKSELTEKDAEGIGHKIKHNIRKRFS